MFNITDFGAVGNGATLNTKAIQQAIDACAAAGGGRVYVPAGTFVTGAISLRSNIEFHLSAGAVLRGSRNFADFPIVDRESHEHHFGDGLLTGYRLTNVAITGRGKIDGQGDVWWKAMDAGTLHVERPPLVVLIDCERALVDGITLENSPTWTLVPILCRDLTISNIAIKNPWKPYHNCDGIDLVSCSNVRISDCTVDTGDDGICLKSVPLFNGKSFDYAKPRIPCENVLIQNCLVEHAHSGVGIWAEVIGGMRNVTVNNCIFDGTRTGIRMNRFFPHPGGYVQDIRMDNIIMRRVEYVFEVANYWDPAKVEAGPDPTTTPVFSNIHFSNITATKARIACEMYGLPTLPVRDISFSNIHIEADKGFELRDAEDILLDNVTVTCPGPALQAKSVRNLEIRRCNAPQPQADVPVIQLTDVRDAWIHGCTAAAGTGVFVGLVGEGNHDIMLAENRLSHAAKAQAPVEPAPLWSSSSYAYSGSAMWRTTGNRNPFLPVPTPVWETIKREWPVGRIAWAVNGIHRLESGAHPEIQLAPGDKRRIYLILGWQVDEQLLILEDGTLLRKAKNFKWQME